MHDIQFFKIFICKLTISFFILSETLTYKAKDAAEIKSLKDALVKIDLVTNLEKAQEIQEKISKLEATKQKVVKNQG